MTGYQEMLTDPSYGGQILIATYPLIGNYGINEYFNESSKIQVNGFIVRSICDYPFHNLSTSSLSEFLIDNKVPAISEIDTRAVTRKIRDKGVMKGLITIDSDKERASRILDMAEDYDEKDFVSEVSTKKPYVYINPQEKNIRTKFNVVLIDLGVKRNILRILDSRDCKITVLPWNSSKETILSFNPDGIIFSPGPGDPSRLENVPLNQHSPDVVFISTGSPCNLMSGSASILGATAPSMMSAIAVSNKPDISSDFCFFVLNNLFLS